MQMQMQIQIQAPPSTLKATMWHAVIFMLMITIVVLEPTLMTILFGYIAWKHGICTYIRAIRSFRCLNVSEKIVLSNSNLSFCCLNVSEKIVFINFLR